MIPLFIFYLVGLLQPVLTTNVNGTEVEDWAPLVDGSFDDVVFGWMYEPIDFDETPFPLPITSTTALPSMKPLTDTAVMEIISSKDDGTDQFLAEIDSFRANRIARAGIFDDDRSSRRSRSSSRSRSRSSSSSRSRSRSRASSRSSWSSSWENQRSSAYYDRSQQYNYGGYRAQPYYGYHPQYNYGYQYRPQYRPQYNYRYPYQPQYRPQQNYGGHRRYYHYG